MSSSFLFVDCDENKTVNNTTSLCVNGTVFQQNSTSQVSTEGRSRWPIVLTMFVILLCTSFAGNVIVLVSWFRNKIPRRIIYFYTSNLASADLLATAGVALSPISNHITGTAGDVACKINHFAINTSFTASILTLVAIGLTRYQTITSMTPTPNPSQQKKNLARKRCWLIWLAATITTSPVLCVMGQGDEPGSDDCVIKSNWPVLYLKVYYVMHLVFFFIIPLLFVMFVSCRIYCVLEKNTALNAQANPPSKPAFTAPPKNINRTKILLSIVFTFMVCVGPFNVARTLELFFESSNIIPFSLWRVFQLLRILNGVLDPVIYVAFSSEIRKAIFS